MTDQLQTALLRAEAERDALRSEVEKYRKAFVWRADGDGIFRLTLNKVPISVTYVMMNSSGIWWWRSTYPHTSSAAAMRAAESALGLPICEVING